MPQFDVSTFSSQLFWLAVIFGFLYLIVSRVIAPTAEDILTSRNRFIDDHVNTADEYNKKSAELQQMKERDLVETNKLAENIRQQAIDSLNKTFSKKKQEVNDEIKLKTDRSMKELRVFADNFHAQETEPCVNLASLIIEKVTGKAPDMKLLNKIEERSK